MGSVNVCRPAMKVTLLIHCLRRAGETHTYTQRRVRCHIECPHKRVRFLPDEISQGLDVLGTRRLSCRMSFRGHYVGCVGRQVKTFTYLPNTWDMDRGGRHNMRLCTCRHVQGKANTHYTAHICKENAICGAAHHTPNTDRPFSGLDSNERLLHLIVFNFSDLICSMFFSFLRPFLKSNEHLLQLIVFDSLLPLR